MTDTYKTTYEILHKIYNKYRKKYRENSDSKQMCCMWSSYDPPDIIEGTASFCDIENAFDICIDDDNALNLYDMNLDEVVIMRLSRLGWTQEQIAEMVKLSRNRISEIVGNTNFGVIDTLLSQGRDMSYIAGHYQIDLALAWTLRLERI